MISCVFVCGVSDWFAVCRSMQMPFLGGCGLYHLEVDTFLAIQSIPSCSKNDQDKYAV